VFNLFSKEAKQKYTPEQQATMFVDIYLQSKCKDNESIVVTDDDFQKNIYIDYNAVVAKKAIATNYAIPVYLAVDLSEGAFGMVLDDILVKMRGEKK
jgi:hypothetical protein